MPEHHTLVRCHIGTDSFQNALPALIEVYKKQFLRSGFYILRSEKKIEARKMFMTWIIALASSRIVYGRMIPPGKDPVQIFSVY